MERADFEALASDFNVPIATALPCNGCGAVWTRVDDDAERNHQNGCPWSTPGVTELLTPSAKVFAPKGKKSKSDDEDEAAFQTSERLSGR